MSLQSLIATCHISRQLQVLKSPAVLCRFCPSLSFHCSASKLQSSRLRSEWSSTSMQWVPFPPFVELSVLGSDARFLSWPRSTQCPWSCQMAHVQSPAKAGQSQNASCGQVRQSRTLVTCCQAQPGFTAAAWRQTQCGMTAVTRSTPFPPRLCRVRAKAHYSVAPVGEFAGGNSCREEGAGGGAQDRLRASQAVAEGQTSGPDGETESIEESTLEAALAGGSGPGLLAFYSDHQEVVLPDGHRFPMDKYRATRLVLEGDASLRGILTTRPSPLVAIHELTLVHDPEYVQAVMAGALSEKEQRATGFPWSPQMVRRSFASTGGTVAAMHAVMRGLRRAAGHIAGGTHHAFRGHGEGFCVFNDIAVASAVALREYPDHCHLAAPILVIDLDVHQGNGTAKIFEDDERVITFSIHGANNYPWRTKMRSNYDVELADKSGDQEYLAVLEAWLPRLFEAHRPSLVFFQAGVDALKEDSFGRLSMTRQGMLQRNNRVYSCCLERGVPLVITMGGGYSRPSDASILAHADVYRSAAYRYCAQYGLKPYAQVGNTAI